MFNIFEKHVSKIPTYPGEGEMCVLVSPAFASIYPDIQQGQTIYIPVQKWMDAHELDKAPFIIPQYTHHSALQHIPFNILSRYFINK